MSFGLFGEYISDLEDSIDSNYPSWPCLYKKKDRSICGKRYFHKDRCVKHYRSPPEKICASCCNRLTFSIIHAKPIYKKSESEVLRLLILKLPHMGCFICQYIKKDGSMCEKGCMSDLGCFRHFNALPRTICPICNKLTYSDTGICSTHKRIYKNA